MTRLRALIGLVLAVASACGGMDPGSPLGHLDGVRTGAASGWLTVDHEAVLSFRADWNIIQSSPPLMAGGRLRVEYDPMRLSNCRATYNGLEAWTITPYYRLLPDASVRQGSFAHHGSGLSATLELPETTQEIELWFVNTDRQGCQAYDSNLGRNYRFPVARPGRLTEIVFGADWSEVASGPIVQGGLARLHYAPERLRACRATYNGGRTWNIIASWIFRPGGQSGSIALYDGNYYAGEAGILRPDVYVPEDATSVEIWFSNSDRSGCVAWDSNFGANYSFEVVPRGAETPAVGWAGDFNFVTYHRDPATRHGDVDPAYYFDSWAGAELASWVEVQVWIPGITDRRYASAEEARNAAASRVRAEARWGAATGSSFTSTGLRYRSQQGNNFVYSFDFNALRWNHGIPDGLYHYYVRFSTDNGSTWYEAGRTGERTRRFVVAPTEPAGCAYFPDHPPPSCPQNRPVGWAGNWGGRFTHACDHVPSLPDPVIFTKSSLGHDCMSVTAEVWVEGLTDQNGDPGALTAQVETDIGFGGGPLAQPTIYPLTFDSRVGNNYRFAWNLNENVARADRGDYRYRFRFSGDGGRTWYVIGKGPGPGGGEWRSLLVRNDSTDTPETSHCENIFTWQGPTNVQPSCISYDIAENYNATYCEFYVNALGQGNLSHNGSAANWLEAYLRVAPQQGQMLNAGMLTRHRAAGGPLVELYSMGTQIEPNYWLTGVTTARSGPGTEGGGAFTLDVVDFAFFIDVRRPTGNVVRLWQSAGGANYTLAACYPDDPRFPPFVKSIGIGSIRYANEGVPLFDQKRACAH
jgi:hypothetical protein